MWRVAFVRDNRAVCVVSKNFGTAQAQMRCDGRILHRTRGLPRGGMTPACGFAHALKLAEDVGKIETTVNKRHRTAKGSNKKYQV